MHLLTVEDAIRGLRSMCWISYMISRSGTTLPMCIWNGTLQSERNKHSCTCAGCGKCNMWVKEFVLDIIYNNPPTSTFHTFSVTRWVLQSSIWCILCKNQWYYCTISTKFAAREKTSVCSFVNGWYKRLWISHFCAVCCGLLRQYLQKVMYTIYMTCMYGQRRNLMLLIAPCSSKVVILLFGLEL
jgi:hypothetical protein